jgi:hypothetical protein
MTSAGHIHQALQGESLHSLAVAAGHRWETVWEHPNNAELRARRQSPDILLPGDEVFIPAIEPGSAIAPTDRRTVFRRRSVPAKLRLVFHDLDGPRIEAAFVMAIDGKVETGATDATGAVERWVSPFARHVALRFLDDVTATVHEFELRHLDPPDSESGVRQRLRQLGYPVPVVLADEHCERQLHGCLRAFQADEGLSITGKIDDATKAALERGHGG